MRSETSKPGDEQSSLEKYADHMKEGQNDVVHCYVISGQVQRVQVRYIEASGWVMKYILATSGVA